MTGSAEGIVRDPKRRLRVDARGRRQDVVARIVGQHHARTGELRADAILEIGEERIVAQLRLDIGVDVADADPPRGLWRELPIDLCDGRPDVQRVTHGFVQIRGDVAEPVDVEVDIAAAHPGQRLEPAVEPATGIACKQRPGTVLRRHRPDARNVGPRKAFAACPGDADAGTWGPRPPP